VWQSSHSSGLQGRQHGERENSAPASLRETKGRKGSGGGSKSRTAWAESLTLNTASLCFCDDAFASELRGDTDRNREREASIISVTHVR